MGYTSVGVKFKLLFAFLYIYTFFIFIYTCIDLLEELYIFRKTGDNVMRSQRII